MKDWLFDRRPVGSPAGDAGLAAFRVVTFLLLAFLHGMGKFPPSEGFAGMIGGLGFPAPTLFAWLAAIAELIGGILIAIGLLTRPAALLVFAHFVFVTLIAHAGDPLGDRELPIIFCVAALMYLLTGPGRYSIDALINRGPRTRELDV